MEALQCANAVIMHFLLNIATSAHNENRIKDFNFYSFPKMVMSRMLTVLFMSKTLAHSWLWIIYIQMLSKCVWPYSLIPDDNSDYLRHNDQLLNYLRRCEENKYLPINDDRSSDPQAFYDIIVKMDMVQYMEQLYGVGDGDNKKKLGDFFANSVFEMDYFVLSDYFHRDTDLFDKPFLEGKIFWGAYKNLLRNEKDTLSTAYRTHQWIKEPYTFTAYHERVLHVLKMNTYSHVWTHMKIFENALTHAKNHVEQINFKVQNRSIWRSPCKALRVIMQSFHDRGDQILFSITDQLCSDVKEFTEEFWAKIRYMAKTVEEIISSNMKELITGDFDVGTIFNVDTKPESKEDICRDLIQLGANESHVRGILYGDLNILKETEGGSSIVSSESSSRKGKEPLSFENEELTLDVSIITESENTVTFKGNKIVERANRFLKYTIELCLKLKPLDVYFIIFFYHGKENINGTFFPNTGVKRNHQL